MSARLSQLRWRCRRGTRELDALLGGFLSREYPSLEESERRLFESLLAREDGELAGYFFGSDPRIPLELSPLVAKIRAAVPN